jgi:hypothetical protein
MGVHAPEMVTKIRLRVGDMQETKYSDYEVLAALNNARTMLWTALADSFSSIPRRWIEMVLVDGRALLPEDYYSLVDKPCGIEIDGFHAVRVRPAPFWADGKPDVITLVYNGLPRPSEELEEILPGVTGASLFDARYFFDDEGNEAGVELVYNGYSFPRRGPALDVRGNEDGSMELVYRGYYFPGRPALSVRAADDGAEIVYKRYAPPLEDEEDGTYIYTTPQALVLDVVEISACILAGDMSRAAAVVRSTASRVSQRREYSHIPNMRPFP